MDDDPARRWRPDLTQEAGRRSLARRIAAAPAVAVGPREASRTYGLPPGGTEAELATVLELRRPQLWVTVRSDDAGTLVGLEHLSRPYPGSALLLRRRLAVDRWDDPDAPAALALALAWRALAAEHARRGVDRELRSTGAAPSLWSGWW